MKDNVGTAFSWETSLAILNPGMSLRDWFAGQALVGLLACPEDSCGTVKTMAGIAYEYADAMLEARKK